MNEMNDHYTEAEIEAQIEFAKANKDADAFEPYVAWKEDKVSDRMPTPADVERKTCPICGSNKYVRPYIAGLIEPSEALWKDIKEGRISVSFGRGVDRFWNMDCKSCHTHFDQPDWDD